MASRAPRGAAHPPTARPLSRDAMTIQVATMGVLCAACGQRSQDPEFCDHCNADLSSPDDRVAPPRVPLPGGDVELSDEQRQALSRVEDAIVLESGGQWWRLHWLPRAELPAWLPGL